ncbi:unnamed protein product [Prorocentrum cordatum]|uniref:Phospholipid scramblase n=1 Tax=Prorocentrum cordatum TaxID=2364126 RepID=A0ABN9PNP3_9DINO|nr:unnamed protein product [Polarella glacialis]
MTGTLWACLRGARRASPGGHHRGACRAAPGGHHRGACRLVQADTAEEPAEPSWGPRAAEVAESRVLTSQSRLVVEQLFFRLFARSRVMSVSVRANGEPTIGLPNVGASLDDVALQSEAEGIALESVRDFMGSARFWQAYSLKGAYLFRVDGVVGDP